MSRLDQAVEARLQQLRDLVRSGDTDLTGRSYRDSVYDDRGHRVHEGKIVGRFKGGMSIAFPELEHTGIRPGQAASAIERHKGKVFRRLAAETRRQLEPHVKEPRRRSPGRPTVAPHEALTAKCKVCGQFHGKGPHRFHGEGSFHQTHLFSFNPDTTTMPTKIYDQVLSVVAKKGRGHSCSPACRRANHTYIHRFKSRPPMTGSADRQTLMIGKPIGGAVQNAPGRRSSPSRRHAPAT